MRLLRILALTIGILTAFSMINCTREDLQEPINSNPMIMEVIRTDMITTVTTTGHIRFNQQAELTFGEGGTVVSVLGDWGARVELGDLIGQLEDGALKLAVAKAETNWLNAQDSLQKLLDGPSKATIHKAEAGLLSAINKSTKSTLKATEVELDYQNVFRRWLGVEIPAGQLSFPPQEHLANLNIDLNSLFDFSDRPYKIPQYWNSAVTGGGLLKIDAVILGGDDPETPWDESIVEAWKIFFPGEITPTCKGQTQQVKAQLALCIEDEMTTRWETYESAVIMMEKDQSELSSAEETLFDLRKPLDQNRITEHEQQVAGTYSALLEAQRELEQAKILAPFDGILTEINVSAGSRVAPRAIAAKIVDPTSAGIIAQVDEIDVSKISIGNTALISIDAFPESKIIARVSAISLVGRNQSGVVTYEVRLELLRQSEAILREGMTIIADIQVQKIEDVLTIPLQAILAENGIRGVQIVTESYPQSEATFRSLEFGESNDRRVVIISGLEEGERILIPVAPSDFSEASERQGRFPGSGIIGGRNRPQR